MRGARGALSTGRVDEALGLVEGIFEGRVTEAECDEAMDCYLGPEYAELPLGLFDLSGVTQADFASAAIRSAASRVGASVDPVLKEGKLALVASREELFGLARMYQILRDPSPV